VAVEGLFTWDWLADRWAPEGMPFVLGQALSMKAIHRGKAKHDPSDSQKIAALRRGGRLPPASVSPAQMRATRDLLRRRPPLRRTRAARLAPVQQTHRPDHLPELGQTIADQVNRAGVAQRLAAPAGHKRLAVDLALLTSDDQRLGDMARALLQAATHPDANTLSLGPTVPGLGKILRRVRRDELPDMARFPSGPDVVS
jgi:hypothetical protein